MHWNCHTGLSLSATLDTRKQVTLIFMLQPQAAILECVSAAGSEAEIQDGLSRLAQVMDWDLLTTLLDLQDRWPSTPSLVGTPSTS